MALPCGIITYSCESRIDMVLHVKACCMVRRPTVCRSCHRSSFSEYVWRLSWLCLSKVRIFHLIFKQCIGAKEVVVIRNIVKFGQVSWWCKCICCHKTVYMTVALGRSVIGTKYLFDWQVASGFDRYGHTKSGSERDGKYGSFQCFVQSSCT